MLLIAGGAGYIGPHVVRPLVCAGHTLIVLDNPFTRYGELMAGDLADTWLLEPLLQATPWRRRACT
ncbi:NAD-dependent epimerase/dehydratase family protein [Ectothiorhodospira magna]|uniref:NAD-dependent epimerase/dehydratase family protein n=1 Tax=Ectothiorhodospira magna TaxID=867345 RepID=UPI001EE41933|nr:NAD-dependent epimerase/dehydratase family protein [Ectothiorhodospira magna]